MSWSPAPQGLGPTVVGASSTGTPVSKEFAITSFGASQALVIKVTTSSATVTTGVTLKLQSAMDSDWVDAKSATVTTSASPGIYYITLLGTKSADQTYLPLLSKGRVVAVTGAGDAVTVTGVYVLQNTSN